MANYLAVYNVHTQPFEEAPDDAKKNYRFVAENDEDAKKKAEDQRIILRKELLCGSTVTLETLAEVKEVALR